MNTWKLGNAVIIVAIALMMLLTTSSHADLECGDGTISNPMVDACIQATDADTSWSYVGKTIGAECPTADNWVSQQLFAIGGEVIPPGLAEFCQFVATTNQPVVQELINLKCGEPGAPVANCLSQLDPDSASVAMMASETADLLWEPLQEHFLEQVDAIAPLAGMNQNTRIAVIDTEPTGFNEDRNGPGLSDHGFSLLNFQRDMICPEDGPCPVQLKSQLGLPLQRCPGPIGLCITPATGGYLGSIARLARAIRVEVSDWQGTNVNNLVINLSLGWDSVFGGNTPIVNSRVAVQAAYRAIMDARCRGALVFVAAGNRVTGPTPNLGALLPGAWEAEPAPDMQTCGNLIGEMPDMADFAGNYRPLVYATSALQTGNLPAETRNLGEPRLTAYGDHAVSSYLDANGDDIPTGILTGSSVSTAVISAAAAAAWHFDENASGDEIMDLIYAAAQNLGRTANFCAGPQPCVANVHRVSVCGAVKAVCDNLPAGSTCPVLNCTVPDNEPPRLPEADIVALFATADTYSLSLNTVQQPLDVCRLGYVMNRNPNVPLGDPCPHLEYYGVQATPWTDGQPGGQYCPTCIDGYNSPGNMYVEIDDAFQGVLSDLTLLCKDAAFRVPGQLTASDKLVVSDIPATCEFEDVAMAYRLNNGPMSIASAASSSLLLRDLDTDGDGIEDSNDNCTLISNVSQLDTNGDGYGNACDTDLNDSGSTNFIDVGLFANEFGAVGSNAADFDGSGVVNFIDFALIPQYLFLPPGPSGLAP